MKIINNVLMLAQGGASAWASYIPVVNPTPVAGSPEPSPVKEEEKEEKDDKFGLLDKNMIKFIYENGLPSDVLEFVSKISSLSNGIHSSLFGPTSTTSQYKLILGMLPRLKVEHDRFTAALQAVERNGGMNEIAVASNGRVVTIDSKGNLNMKSLNLLTDTDDILTNGLLANLRANSSQGAFNTEIINIILNGIGIAGILNYISDIISKLGKSRIESQGYVGRLGDSIIKGLDVLLLMNIRPQDISGMSVDGLYKISNITSTLKALANSALNWIWATLPSNMRTVLQARAKLFGENVSALSILMSMINSQTSDEYSFKLDLENKRDSLGNIISKDKKSSSEEKDGVNLGPAEALFSEKGDRLLYTINYGNTENMRVLGNASLIADSSGNAISKGTLLDAANGVLSTVLDWSSATMGGQELNINQMHRIALDGSRIIGAWLPIDKEEYYKSGTLRPDFAMLKRKELADIEVKRLGLTGDDEIAEIYLKYKIPALNNEDYRRFGIISGYADEGAFSSDPNLDDTLVEVDDDNLREGIAATLKAADKDYEMSGGFLGTGLGKSHIFKGSVYIPIVNDAINASLGSKNYYKTPKVSASEVQERSMNAQKEQSYRKAPSLSSLMQ